MQRRYQPLFMLIVLLLSTLLTGCQYYQRLLEAWEAERLQVQERAAEAAEARRGYLKPETTVVDERQALQTCSVLGMEYLWLVRHGGHNNSYDDLLNACMLQQGFLDKKTHKTYDAALVPAPGSEIKLPRYWTKRGSSAEDENAASKVCNRWSLNFSRKELVPNASDYLGSKGDELYYQGQEKKYRECMQKKGFKAINKEEKETEF